MEIITRSSETEKQTVSTRGYNEKMQVSLNNYGHIVLRFFDTSDPDISNCKNCGNLVHYTGKVNGWVHQTVIPVDKVKECAKAEPKDKPQETLIVLDAAESRDLIRFIKERLQ